MKAFFSAIRIHHWLKNSLIFVPIITAHNLSWLTFKPALLAFMSFSFLASAVYLLNDLYDLEADKQHPTKRNRALASGKLSKKHAILSLPFLLAASFAWAWTLPQEFLIILGCYLVLNIAYSWKLKRIFVLDVILLAGLYVIRILAGGKATAIPVSSWLLMFSTFFFFSLAMMKRFIEIKRMGTKLDQIKNRPYRLQDLPAITSVGIANASLSCLLFALYLNSEKVRVLYSHPQRLWLVAMVLLYWTSRVWILANRNEIDDDPVLFAIKDRVTWILAVVVCGILWWAV